MLQIASGKLFQQEPGRCNHLRGVVHTNLRLIDSEPIETSGGRLLPTNSLRHTKTLVYELFELLEGDISRPGTMGSHGIDPYLNEFTAVVSFALNVTCTADPELTRRLTGGYPSPLVDVPPSRLVRRVFDDSVICLDEDRGRLVEIVNDLIALERKSHIAAMRAIRTYVTALHRLTDDFTLAYTLLVASIESLVGDFDGHRPSWADYDQGKRRRIDQALTDADEETASRVRTALLEIEHVSLGRRFRQFVLDHLPKPYFREEAVGLDNPIGYAELTGALKQAYGIRSRYIHDLQELPGLLTVLGVPGEVVRLDRQATLTFQGMTRLARRVIWEFIKRQPKVEKEDYDYRLERSGIIYAPTAPQYWIHRVENLTAQSGRQRLEGFLEQLAACMRQDPDAAVTDLKVALRKVEQMLPNMSVTNRRPFLALYFIYSGLRLDGGQMIGFDKVEKRYGSEIKRPSVEAMLVHLILETTPEWPLLEHQRIHDVYFRGQANAGGLKVSRTLEAGLTLDLAERYRALGDEGSARRLVANATDNYPGHEPLLRFNDTFDPKEPIGWRDVVLPAHA